MRLSKEPLSFSLASRLGNFGHLGSLDFYTTLAGRSESES